MDFETDKFLQITRFGEVNLVKEYYQINKHKINISSNEEYIFCSVCSKGYLDIAKFLLEIKPDIDISIRGEEPIKRACEKGHLEIVKYLLQIKPDINLSISNNKPFIYSCKSGKLELVKFLFYLNNIKDNKNILLTDKCFTKSFEYICEFGYLNILQFLLEVYPTLNITDNNNIGLCLACEKGYIDIVKCILHFKPDIDIYQCDFFPFRIACSKGYIEIVKLLLNHNNNKRPEQFIIEDAFKHSCQNNQFEIIKFLLEYDPSIDIKKCKILNTIFKNNFIDMINLILEKYLHLYTKEDFINNFYIVCENGNLHLLKLLYKYFPDWLLDKNLYKYNFISACKGGYLELVQQLYEWNPTINYSNYEQTSFINSDILCNAIKSGNLDLIKQLLLWFPDINLSFHYEIPFRMICEYGHYHIAKYFLEIKPDINMLICNGLCFKFSCMSGNLDLVKLFFEYHPDLDISMENYTALLHACYSNYLSIVEYILDKRPNIDFEILKTNKMFEMIEDNDDIKNLFNIYIKKKRSWLNNSFNELGFICSICNEENEYYIITPCNHKFCKKCLTNWLNTNFSCPFCRKFI